ncbi:MAG: hypothetical protein ABJA10_08090 [Aestuariivirga sp.]
MITTAILKRGLGAAILLMLAHALAYAAATPAEQAAEMLAHAQSVDMKCGYLNAADKDTLSNLVARAELALATRESIEATKATMRSGHAAGLAASCSADEKQAVHSILGMARQASIAPPVAADVAIAQPHVKRSRELEPSAVPIENDAPAETPLTVGDISVQEPTLPLADKGKTVDAAKSKHQKLASNMSLPKKPNKALAKPDDLQRYAQMTEAYYMALRCNGGGSQVSGLYASIVAVHDNLIQSHGVREVSNALHSARALAGSHSCL